MIAPARPRLPSRPGMDTGHIRNFAIIAHVDHGKSTLADRMLQATNLVAAREMRAQYLDRMDIERERGITIKAQAVRMPYTAVDGQTSTCSTSSTRRATSTSPTRSSRAMNACEGAVLLVDAAQGMQAQTIANLYVAIEAGLEVIPVLNKIDLPAAEPEAVAEEIAALIGGDPGDILEVSAKTGQGVPELLERDRPPRASALRGPRRADAGADLRLGVRLLPRGHHLHPGDRRARCGPSMDDPADGHGLHRRDRRAGDHLARAQADRCARTGRGRLLHRGDQGGRPRQGRRHGHRRTRAPRAKPLPGYREPTPMVFSGLYPVDSDDFPDLRDALEKLRLNDASFNFEPETSVALGFGFRCGLPRPAAHGDHLRSASTASSTSRWSRPRRTSPTRSPATRAPAQAQPSPRC